MDKKLLIKNLQLKSAGSILFLLLFSAAGFAQKLTLKDAREISYQATETVKRIPDLLNVINDPNNIATDLIQIEGDSYKPSRNQLFYNKDITVENDIDPLASLGNSKDISIDKYMTTLDLQYDKSTDATINYNNLVPSFIKKKDFVFVNVKFDGEFKGKYKVKNIAYKTRPRIATIRMVSGGNGKWSAYVMGISFYDPAKPIESTENNTDIYTDTSATATVVPPDSVFRESSSFRTAKEEQEKAIQANFNEYVNTGNGYFADQRYKDALEMYVKAQNLKAFVPALDKKVMDTKRMVAEYTYDNFKNKGDKAKDERRYNEAIRFYQKALTLKPEANAEITAATAPLNKMLILIASPGNKVGSGLLDEAIDECDKILKEHKKDKSEYPEVFFIKAKAYEAMIAKKPDETRAIDRALENYSFAIQYFPNYLDARIARAAFYIKYKNDFSSAISDYDVLTLSATDDAPEKPIYFDTKGHWKDKVGNYAGALDEYGKAIALNDKNAVFYFDRGEILYRYGKTEDAQKDLDVALKLNPKYEAAFYIRGLNYVAAKNNSSAGADFIEAEKLGFEPVQQQKVDSISNAYFLAAEDLRQKHDFTNADTAYDNALKIRKCNALALHGKAEIRFTRAVEFGKKDIGAKSQYLESIDFNRRAIACNNDLSDAHFKMGLAYNRITNYDKAIKSYDEAIRSDKNNYGAYLEQGNTYQIQQKYAKAVEDFGQAINILKANLEAAKNGSKSDLAKEITLNLSTAQELYGEALYNSKDYDNALIALDQSLNYNEFNSEALYYRGLVRVQQGDFSKAYKDYYAAIKITPKYKYFYANGDASLTNKNYEQAISNYNDAITADTLSTVRNRFYLLGLSYFKNKAFENATTAFASYEKGGPLRSDSSFNAEYGLALLYNNQDSLAVKHLTQAITQKSNDAGALYSMGCSFAKKSQFDKALEYFEKAFATRQLTRDEIKLAENTFLADLYKTKPVKTKYNQLKKQYTD